MKIHSRLALILILSLLLASPFTEPARAEPTKGWSSDAQVPGYLDGTFPPVLLADHNRTVHAFASQWVENDGRRHAIVYRQWSLKGGWTRPMDIILTPDGEAFVLGVYMDEADRIHALVEFSSRNFSNVYYTSAPAEEADSAGAWSTPILLAGPLAAESAAITGDGQGNILIIFSGMSDGSGAYYMLSSDSGETWSQPASFFLTYDPNLLAYSLHLSLASNQHIRATWNVLTSLGVDKSLYFADFNLTTAAWSTPVELDTKVEDEDYFGPSFPELVDTGKQIVIMYNGGNPFMDRPVKPGRPVQEVMLSSDGGTTWNGPSVPFPYHVGRSGSHAMVLDGAGVPHALFVQRIESNEGGQYSVIGGIWHSAFRGGTWTKPERLVTTYTPHDLHAVVSQGNLLLLVWREDPGIGKHGVWFSYNILDAPELPVVPLATAPMNVTIQPTPASAELEPTPTRISNIILKGSSPSNWQTNPAFPIIVGILPAILIVIGVLAAFHFLANPRE